MLSNSLRYVNQVMLREFGNEGQQSLANARVLVIGAGGLGTPLLTYLGSAGVGYLGIVDGDNIEVTNLHRQFLFSPSDTGKSKTSVIAKYLFHQNPGCCISEYPYFISEETADVIVEHYDIICDCTDNAEARVVIDKVCKQKAKPLVFASVRGWEGYITILHGVKKIELGQVFGNNAFSSPILSCNLTGVVNTTCGITGSLQAAEVIKMILNVPGTLDGRLLCFDTLSHTYKVLNI